jgi:hypothetical protein
LFSEYWKKYSEDEVRSNWFHEEELSMYYNGNSRGGRRRPRGIYGFPWLLFFIIFFNLHSLPWILMTLVTVGFVFLIVKAFMATGVSGNSAPNRMGAQQPYYQPYQQPYQPPQEPSYQPYDQGYQPPREAYQEGGKQYQYPSPAVYDQYEQPQAQYPEQMPPMEQ